MVDHIKCLTEVDQYTPDLQEEPLLAGKTYSRQVLLLLLLVYRPVFSGDPGSQKVPEEEPLGLAGTRSFTFPMRFRHTTNRVKALTGFCI